MKIAYLLLGLPLAPLPLGSPNLCFLTAAVTTSSLHSSPSSPCFSSAFIELTDGMFICEELSFDISWKLKIEIWKHDLKILFYWNMEFFLMISGKIQWEDKMNLLENL